MQCCSSWHYGTENSLLLFFFIISVGAADVSQHGGATSFSSFGDQYTATIFFYILVLTSRTYNVWRARTTDNSVSSFWFSLSSPKGSRGVSAEIELQQRDWRWLGRKEPKLGRPSYLSNWTTQLTSGSMINDTRHIDSRLDMTGIDTKHSSKYPGVLEGPLF